MHLGSRIHLAENNPSELLFLRSYDSPSYSGCRSVQSIMRPVQAHPAPEPVLIDGADYRPVRMGIVGANFGAGVARLLADGNEFVELAGICDIDTAKTERLASELDVAAYGRIENLLEDPSIDAVGLYTPPSGRAKLVQQVLQSGRHVMTTKPFELEVRAARAVLDLAAERHLTVHLNSPGAVPAQDIAQIKAWVNEYRLGQPIALRAETWCNYREQANNTWYDDPALCPVAPIFRLGIYFLNDFASLLGPPKTVHVLQTRIFTGRPTADNAQVAIEFESGALATIFASFCIGDGSPWPDKVALSYERGCIYRWMERGQSPHMAGDRAVTELHYDGKTAGRAVTQPGAYAGWYDWKSFHHAIRGIGLVPKQNPDAILYGLRLLDAIYRAASSGVPERVL
jgi:predicted dehydrogenase